MRLFPPNISLLKKCGLVAAVVGTLLPLSACGPRPHALVEQDIQGYQQLTEDMHHLDTSPLAGRLILLDPGHGGFFRGARGPNGLAEADVNLGVALYLRGLLEWAGADVVMTRTTDRDFLTPSDSTLVADLAFRVSMSDSLQPDVFISLHHNSNPTRDPLINETQTYYPVGDSGASLELARSIHRHLALNLRITPAKILPGNFHVLRNATVPAVLGEPAMISNPVMAGRLSLASSQQLEAEAYFLGLLDYFAQGAPTWAAAQGDTIILPDQGTMPRLSWTFVPDHRHRGTAKQATNIPGPDANSFQVLFNGNPQTISISPDGRTVSWLPSDCTATGKVLIYGRNLAGRSTPSSSTIVLPEFGPPPRISVFPEAAGKNTLIQWKWPAGSPGWSGTVSWPHGPIIKTLHYPEGAALVEFGDSLSTESPLWQTPAGSQTLSCPVEQIIIPDPWHWLAIEGLPPSPTPLQTPWRYRMGTPPPGLRPQDIPAAFIAVDTRSPFWLEKAGLLPLLSTDRGDDTAPVPEGSNLTATLLAPKIWNKVIVLDPRGGGSDTDGQGPLGTRGADLNLRMAQLVADYLRGVGARVIITRAAGHRPDDPDKVLLAKKTAADLFLVIGRHNNPSLPRVRHYPGSKAGTAWAQATTELLPDQTVNNIASGPGSDYLLRHTHCPALVVEFPTLKKNSGEIQLSDPNRLRAEASALVLGILGQLSDSGSAFPRVSLPEVLARLPKAPPTTQITSAVWDGNFTLTLPPTQASRTGASVADSLTSLQVLLPARGPRHQLEIHTRDSWQIWQIQRQDNQWQGRMVLSGH